MFFIHVCCVILIRYDDDDDYHYYHHHHYRATLYASTVNLHATAIGTVSVRPSVRHKLVLHQNCTLSHFSILGKITNNMRFYPKFLAHGRLSVLCGSTVQLSVNRYCL